MDLAWLETFLAVVRHRSFTRASETLNLTQPGISRQIQKLERELGVTLFERGSAGVLLTPQGDQFRAFAEATLERYWQLRRELQGLPAEICGDLRIVASTTPGELLVPGLVAAFGEEYPAVRTQVSISDSTTVLDELRRRAWDVGFVGARLPVRGMHFQPIANDEVVLLVPADHPFAGRGEIELDELADQWFIEREGGSGTQLAVRNALARQGFQMPPYRTVMVLGSMQAVISAVKQGYGIGWVSSLALTQASNQRLAQVRIAGLPLQRALHFVYESERQLSPVAEAFIAWMRQHVISAPRRQSS